MAIQVLIDGLRNTVVKVTGPDTVDISTLAGAPSRVRIDRLQYDVGSATVTVEWDATANVIAWTCSGREDFDFKCFGGLWNNAGAGVTGDIDVVGVGSYTVLLELVKEKF